MLGLKFTVVSPDVPERPEPSETAPVHVERLARAKAIAVASTMPGNVVIGGDTVVTLDGRILGKPSSEGDAEAMLMKLAGRTHSVASGLALALPSGQLQSGYSTTDVTFRRFSLDLARSYVATGEPLDKAGAYAIQGMGASLVSEIRGDYYTVVGLPVALLVELLEESGLPYEFPRPVTDL